MLKTLLSGAAACARLTTAAFAQDVTLRFAHFAADTHPGHAAAMQVADRVKARTDGAVAVEVHPANQLGSPPERLEQTIIGAVEQQAILREESKAAGDMMRKAVMAQEAKEIAAQEAAEMQVTRPDLAAFSALMGPARASRTMAARTT